MKLTVLCLCLFMVGCASTSSGGGVQVIENLSESQYSQVTRYIQLGVGFGVGQLLSRGVIDEQDRPILARVSEVLRDTASATAAENVGNLLTDVISQIPEIQEYAQSEYIMALIRVAENFVLERGGFGVVRQADGTWELSERTQGILIALADGIDDALDTTSTTALRSLFDVPMTPEDNADAAFVRARFSVYGTNG